MKQNSEYRAIARQKLSGNWTDAIVVSLIYCVITGLVDTFTTSFGHILILPMMYALPILFLRLHRGTPIKIEPLFSYYPDLRVWTTMLLKIVYLVLWTMLLIIPGFIKAYSYAMTEFIMEDNPEIKNNEAIEASMSMMQGHKMDLFLLDLSFIGWIILSILTFGIGFIWLSPYMNAARAAFYEDLKNNA